MKFLLGKEILQTSILSIFFTLPIIGFVFGMIRELKANVFGIIGVILTPIAATFYSISCVLNLGKVSLDEAGVNYQNLRIWIIPTFILIFITIFLVRVYFIKK